MKNKSHTKEPWSVADLGAEELTVVSESENSDVAYLPGWGDDNRKECEANARLITAAPDLLSAANDVLAFLADWFPDEGTLNGGEDEENVTILALRAAINKAEGR